MKKFLSLVLALVMTMSLVTISAGAKDFTDADSVTYTEAIDVMSAVKVVEGYPDGSFNPTKTLTRAEAAKVICNMILGPTTAAALKADTAPFSDVPTSHWAAGYIAYCANQGIIKGYGNGVFGVNDTLDGFSFMKMLLCALGYDAEVEGYVGANWSINVAKRALNIGLDDGLTADFNGVKAVTREEACLYALNTLKADMVEYGTKTSVNVGGAEVIIAGSTAKTVANTGKTDGNMGAADREMQFAEKYFTKLQLNDAAADVFMRPANKWTVNDSKIGTYPQTPDATYTKDKKLSDIYADLDLDKQIDAVVYRNGVQGASLPIARGISNKLKTGNGVLTEVYYDRDAGTIRIVEIDTYVAEIAVVKAETKDYDAYVTLAKKTGPATTADKFETEEKFEVDDVVLYTFADGEIQSVKKAESKEGVLNTIYLDSKINLAGETYSESKNIDTDSKAEAAKLNVKSSYVLYFDEYGYYIYAKESEHAIGDYAFVEATSSTGYFVGGDQAKLVYLDGTTGKVSTAKNYKSGDLGDWTNYLVTFTTNSKNEVTLKKVDKAVYYGMNGSEGDGTTAYGFYMKNGDAEILIADNDHDNVFDAGEKRIFANSKSVIVVKNSDNKYNVYTGVKAMPSINLDGSADNDISITYYCKSGNILTYAFIQAPTTAITGGSEKITFLAGKSLSKHTTDTDVIDYYTYNAVVNGEITKVRVDADKVTTENDVIYNNASTDSDGIVTNYATTGFVNVTGIKKLSGEHTLGFGAVSPVYYTVADNCKVYFVNLDGDISETTTSAVVTDASQKVAYVLNESYEVEYLFLNEVDTTGKGNLIGSNTYRYGADMVYDVDDDTLKLTITSNKDTGNAGTATVTVYAKNPYSGTEYAVISNRSVSLSTLTSSTPVVEDLHYSPAAGTAYYAKVVIGSVQIITGLCGK